MHRPSPWYGRAAIVAAALLPLVVVRAMLLRESGLGWSVGDLRGFLSDAIAALAFVAVVGLATRRAWRVLALLSWTALAGIVYEHVSANGSIPWLADVGYLLDPVFLAGSAAAPARPVLFAALAVASLALGSFPVPAHGRARSLGLLVGAMLLAVALDLSFPVDPVASGWRQANVVLENLRRALRVLPDDPWQGRSGPAETLEATYRADLDGVAKVPVAQRGRNVLLILLEGISGAHLPSVAERQGVPSTIAMPRLDAFAARNLVWDRFVANQRQTNRGEYAILCGDLPKLVRDAPKMIEALGGPELECLPRVLADAGYRTVYLQAAPLAFMSKDQFMPLIGFQRTLGDEWFGSSYAHSRWGVDDRAFFEQALGLVGELESDDGPWFLTLLTVGTHHPYIVPASNRSGPSATFHEAVAWLDGAVAEFLSALEARGVLNDTLVLVTSDESAGIDGYRGATATDAGGLDDLTRRLSQSWGFLVARLPHPVARRMGEPFMQMDLAVSVLDAVGLASRSGAFRGRSVFREYERERPVVFGNVYQRLSGLARRDGRITLCFDDGSECRGYRAGMGRLFGADREPIEPPDAADEALLRSLVQASAGSPGARGPRMLELLESAEIPVDRYRVAFGGHFLSVGAGTRIDVDLDFEVLGKSGAVRFDHMLRSDRPKRYHFRRHASLRPGRRATLRYSVTVDEDVSSLDCIGTVRPRSGEGLRVRFHEARLRVVPPTADGTTQPGVTLREMRVVAPDPATG